MLKCYKYELSVNYGQVAGIVVSDNPDNAMTLIYEKELCYSVKSLAGLKVELIDTSKPQIISLTYLE